MCASHARQRACSPEGPKEPSYGNPLSHSFPLGSVPNFPIILGEFLVGLGRYQPAHYLPYLVPSAERAYHQAYSGAAARPFLMLALRILEWKAGGSACNQIRAGWRYLGLFLVPVIDVDARVKWYTQNCIRMPNSGNEGGKLT